MKKISYRQFLENIKKSPRIVSLAQHFEEIASGRIQVPIKPVLANLSLLFNDKIAFFIYENQKNKEGKFCEHAYASIPYLLENSIRVMSGIYLYALAHEKSKKAKGFYVFEPGGGSGDVSRILPEVTHGFIKSLCSSATKANEIEFNKKKNNKNSFFCLTPFFNITPDFLFSSKNLSCFANGFDIIYERCTFQMYGNDRRNQIKHVSKVLKKGGIIMFEEKLLNENIDEYNRREKIKNEVFKAKYFKKSQIHEKEKIILGTMFKGMITLSELSEAIRKSFKHAVIIWNSTNFYNVVASNSQKNLKEFISYLLPPCVPPEFNFEAELPKKLFGLKQIHLSFREPS